jgi:hypothetical protein
MKRNQKTVKATPPIADIGATVKSHLVYQRFQPTETSRMGSALSAWAHRFGDITPVASRLEGLRADLENAEAMQHAFTWETDVSQLTMVDPLIWGLKKTIVLAESELARRQTSAQVYDAQIQTLSAEVSGLVVKRAQLASDEVRSLLTKSERESQATQLTNRIIALTGHNIEWTWTQELESRRNPRQEAATERLQAQLNQEAAERHEKEIALRQSAPVESMPMGGLVR